MLELWGMQTTLSLPLWPEVVAPDRVLSMGQMELNCVLMLNWIIYWLGYVFLFNGITAFMGYIYTKAILVEEK